MNHCVQTTKDRVAHSFIEEANLDKLLKQLEHQGWCYIDQFLPKALTLALLQEAQHQQNEMTLAGIGREADHQLDTSIRRDLTLWLNPEMQAQAAYLIIMEQLRLSVNRYFFSGLFDYEAHFAHYPPGGFYKTHYDAFKGQSLRILTSVFYLNTDWHEDHGGNLRLYNDQYKQIADIAPIAGRLLLFWSDQFPHEVLATQQHRYSIAGWYRHNASTANRADPAS